MTWREWLGMAFCEAPGEPSIRRIVFGLVFVFAMGLCVAGLWLEVAETVKTIAITLITTAAGVVGIGRFAEALDGKGSK